MEDLLKYSLLEKASKITMPTLFIVGEKDDGTPLEHQKLFFDKIEGEKELSVIKGAGHNFRTEQEFNEIKKIVSNWVKKIKQSKHNENKKTIFKQSNIHIYNILHTCIFFFFYKKQKHYKNS